MSHRLPKRIVLFLAVLLTLAAPLLAASAAQAGGVAEYTIRPGDTLTGIAARFEITLAQLLAVNPQITDPGKLRGGQVIYLPPGRGEGLPKTGPKRILFWEVEKNGGRVEKSDHLYRVNSGDNFYKIARKFGLTFQDLVDANPQTTAGFLYRGELIHIPIEKLGEGVFYGLFYETPGKPGDMSR